MAASSSTTKGLFNNDHYEERSRVDTYIFEYKLEFNVDRHEEQEKHKGEIKEQEVEEKEVEVDEAEEVEEAEESEEGEKYHNDLTHLHKHSEDEKDSNKKKRQRRECPVSVWYNACKTFLENPGKYQKSQINFLRSEDSGMLDESYQMSFGKRLHAFKAGKLPQDDSVKRVRNGKYHDVEQCLIGFMETRDTFSKGKIAVTWPFLMELAKRFAIALGYSESEFRASPGWLSNVLRRNKRSLSNDTDEEDVIVHLDSIKQYCRRNGMSVDVLFQCDKLDHMIRHTTDGNNVLADDKDKDVIE